MEKGLASAFVIRWPIWPSGPSRELVAEVASGSPAEQAGIQKGDIVTAVDGKPIRSATQLRNSVGLTPVRHRIQLTLVREVPAPRGIRRSGSTLAPAAPAAAAAEPYLNSGARKRIRFHTPAPVTRTSSTLWDTNDLGHSDLII